MHVWWYCRWIYQMAVRRAERKTTQWCLLAQKPAYQWLIITFTAAHRASATQEAVLAALVEVFQSLHGRMDLSSIVVRSS